MEGPVVRPLLAKLLPPSIPPERLGWVKREDYLQIEFLAGGEKAIHDSSNNVCRRDAIVSQWNSGAIRVRYQ